MNLRQFSLTAKHALYDSAGDGYVSGLIEVCALVAPNKGLLF